jgi:hypothetical protein
MWDAAQLLTEFRIGRSLSWGARHGAPPSVHIIPICRAPSVLARYDLVARYDAAGA